MSADRTYWHVPGARSWHAAEGVLVVELWRGACGRVSTPSPQLSDRVPPNGHLCGSCSRVIAARTDIEAPAEDTSYGTVAPI